MDGKLKYLGWYQIAGGILGLFIILWTILNRSTVPGSTLSIFFIAMALYAFSIYCGSLLIQEETKSKTKIKWTRINQSLQIIHLSAFGITYKFYSGIQLSFGVDLSNNFLINFLYSLSGFELAYSSISAEIIVMINIVPILILKYLTKVND
ncbi:hypothetical protein HUW51_15380 [Adhaeribacter swui]|uniref:Uncharacterized protein n=1 Tax=Adhaeribacter swui TaxID=2086471 RepID=A0A7G7GA51_9BACT|nr:hypothetical protein [Adhaeribacter swui]QNF34035.1 hypothetical protein HUW51_15380 [Adhaeribacter swui]